MISRLLTHLKKMPFLADYGFSIYEPGLTEAPDGINRPLCGAQGMSHLCRGLCVPFLTAVSKEALASGKAVFFRCPRSRFVFVIPLTAGSCLVCGGAPSVDSEKKAQEMILAIRRLIATFMSGEKTRPLDSVQLAIGSYSFQQEKQPVRQCRR